MHFERPSEDLNGFPNRRCRARCLDNNRQRETRPHKPEVTVSKTALEHTVALL
jgi:hypothetical protein